MTNKQKTAVSTAYKIALSPSSYPYVSNTNTPQENAMICKTLEGIFDFDEAGNVIDFSEESVRRLNWISECPQ